MEVRWIASLLTSGLHAAHALLSGRVLADQALSQAIQEPAWHLARTLTVTGLPEGLFWRHLLPLSARVELASTITSAAATSSIGPGDPIRELALAVVRKSADPDQSYESLSESLVSALADIRRVTAALYPDLVEELDLRSRPLREQWESRGPGLLVELARITEESLLAPSADVIIVHPALGGGGDAQLVYNSVRIEAVLYNALPGLPETLRLAWMLGQLNQDLPKYSDGIHGHRLPSLARLALLPPTLEAAGRVELARLDKPTLVAALEAWDIATPAGLDTADLLLDWWATYQETRVDWRVSLGALEQMLRAASQPSSE